MDLEGAVSIAREVWGLESPPSTSSTSSTNSTNSTSSDGMPRALDSYDDNNFYLVRLSIWLVPGVQIWWGGLGGGSRRLNHWSMGRHLSQST